jgi:hypothetical protein
MITSVEQSTPFLFSNKREATAATPVSIASSQTEVRELSPKVHHRGQKVKLLRKYLP